MAYRDIFTSNNNNLRTVLTKINELPKKIGDIILQKKNATPKTTVQTIVADSGYDGLSEVTIEAIASAEQAVPTISVGSDGTITATAAQTAGWVEAGTKTVTEKLVTQGAKTITPNSSSQIAVSSGIYTTGDITVAAIPNTYIQPTATKGATTYTPTTTNQTIAAGTYLTGLQTIKGDSNLKAENIKKGISVFGVTGTAESGGETVVDDVSKAIIEKTITEISDDRIKKIGSNVFYACKSLTSANFPACTTISHNAFSACTSLTSVNFPVCTSISNYAFCSCKSLTSINFPVCRTIGYYAFSACESLTSANFPVCTSIYDEAFYNCTSLTSVNFPVCTSIGRYAFYACESLTSVNFPVCTSIYNCAFGNCTSLTSVNFPVCTSIDSYAFRTCYRLSIITLGASRVCTLLNSNAFTSTPFAGYSSYFSGTPIIYVPASLLTAYQTATNWTYFSSYFRAIEGEGGDSGNNDNEGSSGDSTIIAFTIYGFEYQAENGMTWAEWVDSEYNICECSVSGNYIVDDEGDWIYYPQSATKVKITDVIEPNTAYGSILQQQ